MKLNFLSYLAVITTQIYCDEAILNKKKPLHIGVSITYATRSHIKYLLEILEVVSKRGHRITFLCMDEMRKFGKGYNLTYYSLGSEKITVHDFGGMVPYSQGDNMFTNLIGMREDLANLYKVSFPNYEKFYKEEKPDLIVCDNSAASCVDSAAKNSIPMIIGYQSLMYTYISSFLTVTGGLNPTTIESYSFLQRMKHAFIDPIRWVLTLYPFIDLHENQKRIHKIPKTLQSPAFGHMGIGIANSFVGLENARNIPSHIYPIGPILSEDIPVLSNELKKFMDSHSKVLYAAFGTSVKPSQGVIQKLLEHFQRLMNQGALDGIVWGLPNTDFKSFPKSFKVDNTEYSTSRIIEGAHNKIKILKWAPQQAILNHKNTKLFLSHGGLDSIYESMSSGIPMLILPFLGDQPRNAMLVTESGVGDYIDWSAMTDKQVYQKIFKLLDPGNLELKSKVYQMQLITEFSSKRKLMAADLVETYAYSAKSCRQFDIPKPFEAPCEILPFLPLDKRISSTKAKLIDVYITAILIITIVLFSTTYFAYYSLRRLIILSNSKEKLN